jgi:exoribonuclease R
LGDEFEGIIVDFTKAGMIVELDGFFVSGLIPYSDLGKDYFYQKTEKVLSGRKTGKSFELGSHLRVILVAVDPIFRRMNLMLPERAAIGGQF